MPRPQTARSSARSVDDDSKRPSKKNTKQLLSEVLGEDPDFADKFFGESPNMNRMVRPAEDAGEDISMVDGEGANGIREVGESDKQASKGSGHARIPRHVGNSAITIENTPHDIDHLIIRQLEEDLDSYRYDVDFCKTQLDPDNIVNITPAEARTFQLRLLDLGHQMRSIHHRIQLMQAGINNSFFSGTADGRAGALTANAYYGAYPPGTSISPAGQQRAGGPGTPYDGRQSGSAYSGHYNTFHERRGPGRPLGSKNRMKSAYGAEGSGSAKAAALASAGAKRDLPAEGMAASPNGDAPTEDGAGPSAKRPRVDSAAESPTSNNADGQPNGTPALSANGDHHDDGNSDASGIIGETSETGIRSGGGLGPSTPTVAAQQSHYFASSNQKPSTESPYTRLGRWMCTLCTSQKYLKAPTPKQPAEPSSWALRDISKIVTHFTRMHSEHTDAERCQELGNALRTNSGPFKYWIRVTKKTPVSDEEVQQAIDDLQQGNLPELLRRLSTAAAQFPRRN